MKLIPIIDNIMAELDNDTNQQANDIQRKRKAKRYLGLARNTLAGKFVARNTLVQKPVRRSSLNSADDKTISQCVQEILADAAGHPMHLDEIHDILTNKYHRKVTRKNLSNTLNRWISRGKVFDRPAPNTYALRT